MKRNENTVNYFGVSESHNLTCRDETVILVNVLCCITNSLRQQVEKQYYLRLLFLGIFETFVNTSMQFNYNKRNIKYTHFSHFSCQSLGAIRAVTMAMGRAVPKAPTHTAAMATLAFTFVNLGLKGAIMVLYLSAAKATRV